MTTTSLAVPTVAGHDFHLPPDLAGLGDLAYNLWWTWSPRAQALFSRINPSAWARHRNSIAVLRYSDQAEVGGAHRGRGLHGRREPRPRRVQPLHGNGDGPGTDRSPDRALPGPIAYFCAEYGIHESMQIYSGGLGVLAGDHCKSASDAALPFIGLGLLYRRGYFRQQIDADGHQEHAQPDLDPGQLPLRRARGLDGAPLESRSRSPTARSMPRSG